MCGPYICYINVPDVMNPDVLIPGLIPQLCCCTAKHRSVVSHTVSMGLTKARDSHHIPDILALPFAECLAMVCDCFTHCPRSRGGIMLLQWSKGRPWSRIVYSNDPLWESLLPCCSLCHNLSLYGTAHQTFPFLPLLPWLKGLYIIRE